MKKVIIGYDDKVVVKIKNKEESPDLVEFHFDGLVNTPFVSEQQDNNILKDVGDIVISHIPVNFELYNQNLLQEDLRSILNSPDLVQDYNISIGIYIQGKFQYKKVFSFLKIQKKLLVRLIKVFIRRHNVRHKHIDIPVLENYVTGVSYVE